MHRVSSSALKSVTPMEPVTLGNCKPEPIYLLGQMQPHDVLLGLNLNGVLTYVASMLRRF